MTGRSVHIYEAQSAKHWGFMTTLMNGICPETSICGQSRLYQILSTVPVLRNTTGNAAVYVKRIMLILSSVN
jgi:hypothetical protein